MSSPTILKNNHLLKFQYPIFILIKLYWMLPHYRTKKAIRLEHSQEANISTSLTGITLLKACELKSRFSGSRKFVVDRRGILREKPKTPAKQKKYSNSNNKTQYKVNKSRVIHILRNYINSQKNQRQLFFYTVSFPQQIEIETAYKCLNSWLTSLRQAYNLKNYIWIAEKQQNGTIHFHIAIREFLPIQLVNNLMKKLLHYYIRKKELNWNHFACSKYNGVDINKDRSTKKVINYAKGNTGKNLSLYLTKYITKGNEYFERQAWQCSKTLSAIFTRYNMTYDEFESQFLHYIDIDNPKVESEFFIFYSWIAQPPPEIVYVLNIANHNALQMC